MSDPTETPASSPSRGLRIALIVSLALNLAVAGLIAGFWIRGPSGPGMAMGGDGFSDLVWSMPRESRRDLAHDFRNRKKDLETSRAAFGQARQSLIAALQARPFDRAALEQALVEQQQLLRGMADSGIERISQRIAAMTDEQRAEMAENLMKPRHR